MKIKFLKAYEGDSILISYDNLVNDTIVKRNILIDGGIGNTYFDSDEDEPGELKINIDLLREKDEKIDLLIVTHIDDDHIGGILKWFAKDPNAFEMIGKVWFNSGKLIGEYFKEAYIFDKDHEPETIKLEFGNNLNVSAKQGVTFENYITEKKIWERKIIKTPLVYDAAGIKIEILSPNDDNLKALLGKWEKDTKNINVSGKENDYDKSLEYYFNNDTFKEDRAVPNGSSIAFIMTLQGKKMLFLADSHPNIIVDSLKKLNYSKENPLLVDFVKVSHHGSKANSSIELLKMISSPIFIILTNGDSHNHPHKQFLARLINIHPKCKIAFNYPERITKIFSAEELKPILEKNSITFENNTLKL